MSKKRKNNSKSVSSRERKKSKMVTNLRERSGDGNFDGSDHDVEDIDGSEIIEISSDDRSEVAIVDCVNPTRFTCMAQKDEFLFEEDHDKEDKTAANITNRSRTSTLRSRSTISISESDTVSSIRSNKRNSRSSNKNVIKPMIEEMYIIEKILSMRELNGVRQFLLKWEGFPDSENSWEPEENIDSKDIIMEFLMELEKAENLKKMRSKVSSKRLEDKCQNISIEKNNKKLNNLLSTQDLSNIGEEECTDDAISKDANESKINEDLDEKNDKGKVKNSSKSAKKKKQSSKNHCKMQSSKEKEIDLTVDDEEVQEDLCKDQSNTIESIVKVIGISDKCDAAKVLESDFNVEVPLVDKKTNADNNDFEKEGKMILSDKVEDNGKSDELAKDETTNSSDYLVIKSVNIPLNKVTAIEAGNSDTDQEINKRLDNHVDESAVTQIESQRENLKEINQNSKSSNISLNPFVPKNVPHEIQEIFMVEKILRMRWSNGVRYFYLKWEGFPDSENSWEPECNLECPELIEEFLNDLKKPKPSKRPSYEAERAPTTNKSSLEILPEVTKIREPPSSKPRGFPKEREAEAILASGIVNDELSFLIKWKNVDMAHLVPARRANIECPQLVIRFYENNLRWQNMDGSVTILPDDSITVIEETEETRRLRLDTKKNISNSSVSISQRYLESISKIIESPIKKKQQMLGSLSASSKKRGRPMSKLVSPGILQSRKLTTSANKMLNMINNFQSRKSVVSGRGEIDASRKSKTTVMHGGHHIGGANDDDSILDLDVVVSRLYESMDLPGDTTGNTSASASTIGAVAGQDESRPSLIPGAGSEYATLQSPPMMAVGQSPVTTFYYQAGGAQMMAQQSPLTQSLVMQAQSTPSPYRVTQPMMQSQPMMQAQPTQSQMTQSPHRVTQAMQHQVSPLVKHPSTQAINPTSLSLSQSFHNITSVRQGHTRRGGSTQSSIMGGPRSYQQKLIWHNNYGSSTRNSYPTGTMSQHSSPSLATKQGPQQAIRHSRKVTGTLCPIQKQNSIENMMQRVQGNELARSMSASSLYIGDQSQNMQSLLTSQYTPVHTDSLGLGQYQQVVAMVPRDQVQSLQPVHYLISNPTQQHMSRSYVLAAPSNSNHIYFSSQDLNTLDSSSSISSLLPQINDTQLPLMLDSQSHTLSQQNDNHIARNTYLNLGSYL